MAEDVKSDLPYQLSIDFEAITELFTGASAQGRNSLFEHETYELLAKSGAETPPGLTFSEKAVALRMKS